MPPNNQQLKAVHTTHSKTPHKQKTNPPQKKNHQTINKFYT